MANNELAVLDGLMNEPITLETVNTPAFAEKYNHLMDFLNKAQQIKTAIDAGIKDIAKENYYSSGENTLQIGDYKCTYVGPSTRETFDSKKFKASNPDLYKDYVKVSSVSESVRITKIAPEVAKTEEIIDV